MRGNFNMLLLVAWLMTGDLHVLAQPAYNSIRPRSTVTIKGTSNLHDWEMEVRDFDCSVMLFQEPEALQLQAVRFVAKAGSITHQSSIMNNKTHDALMTDRYPDITFQASTKEVLRINQGAFQGSLTGTLRIAGEANRITLPFTGEILSGAEVLISGSEELRMSDFGIRPPTAILGTLKTGDEVTVDFRMVLKREQVNPSP